MGGLAGGTLDRLVRIERPEADQSFDGAGSGQWATVEDNVWAGIKDMLPSRGERMSEGLNVAARPARVRMRYREDITAAMRIIDVSSGSDGRVMQIITPPTEIGHRDGIEFMVEDYSTAGNAA